MNPAQPSAKDGLVNTCGSGCEEKRIDGRQEIILGILDHENEEQQNVSPTKQAIHLALFRAQVDQPGDPYRESGRMDDQDLLDDESERAHLGNLVSIVAKEFEGGKAVECVPQNIWEQKCDCNHTSDPEPLAA